MFRIFRKVRREVLSRKGVSTYLLYALGEIILVVIGILIALQINNWNEDRQNNERSRDMLEQLLEENSTNMQMLLTDKGHRDSVIPSLTGFIYFLQAGAIQENNEELRNYLLKMAQSESYSFSQNYLLRYINYNAQHHSELTGELVGLNTYQKDLEYISEKALDMRLEDFFKFLGEEVDFTGLNMQSYGLLSSLKFKNNMLLIRAVETEVTNQFNRTLRQQQKVDSLIRKYLPGHE